MYAHASFVIGKDLNKLNIDQLSALGHGACARQRVNVSHTVFKYKLELARSPYDDNRVYTFSALYDVPPSTRVNSVVVSSSHQYFSGLVVKLAKNGIGIFQVKKPSALNELTTKLLLLIDYISVRLKIE